MMEGKPPIRRTNAVPIAEEFDDNDQNLADLAPPPAYGDSGLDQLQLSQAGFAADAAITSDGRININISEKNRRLSQLLTPAINSQLSRAPSYHRPGTAAEPPPPPYIPPSLGGQPGQTPPPRLNVVIQIVGSRGDVQPFIALGQVLRDTYGHRVRVATHPTFKQFVLENGLEFFDIGGDPAELMAFMVKHPGLMPGFDAIKTGEIKKRRQGIEEILKGCWRSCIEAGDGASSSAPSTKKSASGWDSFVPPGGDQKNRPFVADAIIANPPSFAHIHVAEKLGVPLHIMFTMPWTPTRAFPHPLADIVSTNADDVMTNYVSYALVEMMTWQGLGDVINRFRTDVLDLETMSLLWAPGILSRLRIPTTYCWSPALIPKPTDWADEVTISGFFFLNLESSYTPDPELASFLAAGPPPVYIGFGSIVVDDPDALTRTILDAIAATGVRALVSKGWGGIGGDSLQVPSNVFMLGNCPHDWLFKRVSAVVHHGGAGTTAAGIKAGKPTVVVPFFGDQIFWGTMITRAGAGPAPIPHKTLNATNLAAAIQEALRPETQARATELGQRIREEQGADVGGKSFHEFLQLDKMRCSLAPSRVAVWRVKRSQVRLSALAAAVLVKEGWLKHTDLKLYRSVEHNTEEQPWDPISAATAALVGDLGALGMAVADFPREIFKGASKGKKSRSNTNNLDPSSPPSTTPSGVLSPNPDNQLPGSSRSETASSISNYLSKTSAQSAVDTSITSSSPPSHSSKSSNLAPSAPTNRDEEPSSSTAASKPITLDLALGAGRGAMRILGTSAKIHTNFCLGVARGFRNAPKLYNDDTVRPSNEKVTSFSSGLKLAGKEFGLGFYDGVAGLVTQPLRGAEKEGGMGFVKGFGKGIGGLVLKPAAGFWALPAYTFAGVQAEVRSKVFGIGREVGEYIAASRVKEGEVEEGMVNEEERRAIVRKWTQLGEGKELKGFRGWKQKEQKEKKAGKAQQKEDGGDKAPPLPPRSGSSSSSASTAWGDLPDDAMVNGSEEAALELAIRESVKQTSVGDAEEDARIEAAVRASVNEMKRAAEEQQRQALEEYTRDVKRPMQRVDDRNEELEDLTNITDEEYQALIEEAIRRSLLEQQQQQQQQQEEYGVAGNRHYQKFVDEKAASKGRDTMEARRAIEASSPPMYELPGNHSLPGYSAMTNSAPPPAAAAPAPALPPRSSARSPPNRHDEDEDEDEQLRRAIEESEREHRAKLEREKAEEEMMLNNFLEHCKAEDEYARRHAQARGGRSENQDEDDDNDEELKRAKELSLKSGSGSNS